MHFGGGGCARVCYVSLKTANMCNCMVLDVTAIFFSITAFLKKNCHFWLKACPGLNQTYQTTGKQWEVNYAWCSNGKLCALVEIKATRIWTSHTEAYWTFYFDETTRNWPLQRGSFWRDYLATGHIWRVALGTIHKESLNPFRLSFSEPKCARGGHIIFLESIFQHSPHEIVIYSINRKSYNKKVNIL